MPNQKKPEGSSAATSRNYRAGAAISLEQLSITLGKTEIVSRFSLSIEQGQFACLLGPSGCGKSTVLNAIGGFVPATSGRILLNDTVVQGPGIERGIVFQSTECLFPWLTVRENVEYGPRIRGIPKKTRSEAALHYINLVGLGGAIDRFPHELSGGMQQRTQIARVLVNEPSVILMDEPFGALDAQTRRIMQAELNRIWRSTGATVLFITHDIGEAVLLGDVVVTMGTGPSARIKNITPIDIPHPRDLADENELTLYRKLRAEIEEEATKTFGLNDQSSLSYSNTNSKC